MATNRIIRTNRSAPAPASAAPRQSSPPPLRTASRTVMPDPPANPERQTQVSHHQGRATVSENTQDEVLPGQSFLPGDAYGSVRVGVGKTVNTGNFSAVRIDVAVTLPFIMGDEENAYWAASEFVHEKLAEEESYVLGTVPAPRTANRRG